MYNMKEKQGLNVTRKEYSMKMQLFFVIFSYFYFVLEWEIHKDPKEKT